MKKLILLIAILFVSPFAFAQQEYKSYYDNGVVKETGQFDANSKQDGAWKMYFESGKLWNIATYRHGKLIGERLFYNDKGTLTNIIYAESGLTENYDSEGNLSSLGKFESTSKIGQWNYYYPSGRLMRIENYKAGKLHGNYESYEDHGKLYAVGHYGDGKQTGKWKYYHDDGKLKEVGQRKNDNRVGKWTAYYKNGQVMVLRHYKDGAKTGDWKYFNDKGKLLRTETYPKELNKRPLN